MHASFKPHGEMVLVREDQNDNFVRPSGLILTQDLNRHTIRGEVVEVGDGEVNKRTGNRVPVDVEVGDTVFYMAYSGNTEITSADGEKYTLVANRDIIAKEL